VGCQIVLSAVLAPTLILGGVPVRSASLASAACVKSFRASVPLHSGQRSPSMLNESSVEASGEEDGGAMTGTDTSTVDDLGATMGRAKHPAAKKSDSSGSDSIVMVQVKDTKGR
jgi:hypothetical protein